VAKTPYFQTLFSKPFKTFILTAYSIGREDDYWTKGITAEQKAEETRQFHDLTQYLLTIYKGTGKTFVLQHWEGDWAIRSGQGKPYDPKIVPTQTAVDGMIQWINARQAGIVQARKEMPDSDVHVYGATEVNRIEDAMAGMPVVADAVLPHTTVDLVSYSCYTFLTSPKRLAEGVNYIVAHLPPTAIFGQNAHSVYLGEYGYPENGVKGAAGVNDRLNTVLQVVKEKDLPWAIYWEVYCNEPKKTAPTPPVTKDEDMMGYWLVKPDARPSVAWHRLRQQFAASNPDLATTDAIKAKLTPLFQENFDRADSTDLGIGWKRSSHYGVVNEKLINHQLRFDIPEGNQIPWGSATLDLTNPAILGRGLNVGEYFEFTLRRLSDWGMLGVELFDSDQLRQGSGEKGGPSPLQVWDGRTWIPFSIDDKGNSVDFDWSKPHVLGVRMDSANGYFDSFSYYIDGHYAGSWLIKTGNKTLNRLGVYAQSGTSAAAFVFDDLKVYGTPRK
jgi:hypothetical protein